MDMLAQMNWGQWFLVVLLIAVCCLLVLVVLVQRGRGGGLAGAFGGAGGTSAFGAKTGDVFTWITVVVATVFVLLNVAANFLLDQSPRPGTTTPVTAEPLTPETEGQVVPEPVAGAPAEVPPTDKQLEGAGGTGTEERAPTPDAGSTAPSGSTPGDDEAPSDAAGPEGGGPTPEAANPPRSGDEGQSTP